jgi:hypothetical protein
MRDVVMAILIISLIPCEGLMAAQVTPPSNPDEVHRVAMDLGVGRYVAVKLIASGTMRGYIRQIADDHFALLLDGMAAPTDIAYGDVRQLRPISQLVLRSRAPSLSKVEKIVSEVAFGSFLVMAFAKCHNKSC